MLLQWRLHWSWWVSWVCTFDTLPSSGCTVLLASPYLLPPHPPIHACTRLQVAAMPALEQLRFCTFVHRLSRSARPAQRLVAVDMAHSLLLELPEPFALTAGWKVGAGRRLLEKGVWGVWNWGRWR